MTKAASLWRSLWRPQRRGWTDRLIATLLATAVLLWLGATLDALGYARDEGFYFHAADSYQRWFELLLDQPAAAMADVDRYWSVNHEHPALIKSAFALSHWLLFDQIGLLAREGSSYRLIAMLLGAAGVGLTYLWGARACGRLAGVLAALWLIGMPRFFFHAHLACFDVPIVTMWLLCAYAYWRSLRRGGAGAHIFCGIAFALALNTKHNAWFLPIVCAAHAALLWLPGVVRDSQRELLKRRAYWSLMSMATLGPLLFYLMWPWIWHDTLPRLRAYALFHLQHVYYNMEYLGRNYFRPPMPRSYAFVMTAATMPLVTLGAFALGAGHALRRGLSWLRARLAIAARLRGAEPTASEQRDGEVAEPATLLLWVLAVAVQYAAWLRPTTPIFGGTKHWMTAYPFIALIAALGAVRILAQWRRGLRRRGLRSRVPVVLAMAAALTVLPLCRAGQSHPWGLSWYNALVGGPPGGASLGLNRGFWGYTTLSLAAEINARVPPGGRVYIHDTAVQAWAMLVKDGRIRKDIRPAASAASADVALYHHEMHMRGVEYQHWEVFGTVKPAAIAGIDGVPVIWLYQRP